MNNIKKGFNGLFFSQAIPNGTPDTTLAPLTVIMAYEGSLIVVPEVRHISLRNLDGMTAIVLDDHISLHWFNRYNVINIR
jgi:hypothetical protein